MQSNLLKVFVFFWGEGGGDQRWLELKGIYSLTQVIVVYYKLLSKFSKGCELVEWE